MIIMKKIYFTLIALLASINMFAQGCLLTIVASCCKDSHGILTTTPNGLF